MVDLLQSTIVILPCSHDVTTNTLFTVSEVSPNQTDFSTVNLLEITLEGAISFFNIKDFSIA